MKRFQISGLFFRLSVSNSFHVFDSNCLSIKVGSSVWPFPTLILAAGPRRQFYLLTRKINSKNKNYSPVEHS